MPTPMNNSGYIPSATYPTNTIYLEDIQSPLSTPASVITSISAIPIFMQAKIPDCVENGVTFLKKWHIWKKTGIVVDLSRRFLAILTVNADKIPFDQGTTFVAALAIEKSIGICESTIIPDDHQINLNPPNLSTFLGIPIPATAYTSALQYTSPTYAFVRNLSVQGLKNAINQNGVILIGIDISNSWWTAPNGNGSWAASDILPIRPPKGMNDPTISKHCIALYGYDNQYFYFVNWWGKTWGNGGLGYFGLNDLPYVYEGIVVLDPVAPANPAVIDTTKLTPVQNAQYTSYLTSLVAALTALYKAILAKKQ